jgi:hypothetical protein
VKSSRPGLLLAGSLLAGLPLLAACASPTPPLQVSGAQYPTNVVLGAAPTPPAAPGGPPPAAAGGRAANPPFPTAPVVGLPPLGLPAAIPAGPPPNAGPPPVAFVPRPACPNANPFAAPAQAASESVTAPPVAADYVFRNSGAYQVAGPDAVEGRFPARSTQVISQVATDSNGDFTFSITENLGFVQTTTSYQVVPSDSYPHGAGASTTGAPGTAGLFVTAVSQRDAAGKSTFAPSPALAVVNFPVASGNSLTARGADPVNGEAESYDATVAGLTRVNACGKWLQAVQVNITSGAFDSASEQLQFTQTLYLATQFGGIPVAETDSVSGTEGSDSVSYHNTSTIDSTPRTPGSS